MMTKDSYEKKDYIKGTVREVATNNGRKIINISINAQQLTDIANEDGFANIAIYQLSETDKYGNTHFIVKN